MNLIVNPSVSGDLGIDTKNVFTARASVPVAALTQGDFEEAGIKVGDTIYVTDSDDMVALYKVDAGFTLSIYVIGGGSGTGNVSASGAFGIGDILVTTTVDGEQVVSGGPAPVIDPNTVTSPIVGVADVLTEYVGANREIQSSGIATADVVQAASTGVNEELVQWDGNTKNIKNTSIATTDVVTSQLVGATDDIALYAGANKEIKTSGTQLSSLAPIDSPDFTGGIILESAAVVLPTAGQASLTGNTLSGTTILGSGTASDLTIGNKSGASVLAVPTGTTDVNFTGKIEATTTTQTPLDNSTKLSSTAYVDAAVGVVPVGDVVGPASATDEAVTLFDGTTGKLIKNSTILLSDLDDLLNLRNNTGQVKVIDKNSLKPTGSLNAFTPAQVEYSAAGVLTLAASPVTHFPPANTTELDSSVYDNTEKSWLENIFSLGQINQFRFRFSYTGIASTNDVQIFLRFHNTFSGFELNHTEMLVENQTAGDFVATFVTVSDANSVPLPVGSADGHGYNLEIDVNRNGGTWILEDVLIASHATSFT